MSRRESKKSVRRKEMRSSRWVRDELQFVSDGLRIMRDGDGAALCSKWRDPKRAVARKERPAFTPGTKGLTYDEALKLKGKPRSDTASYSTFKGHRVTKPKGGKDRRARDHLRKAEGALSDLPYDEDVVVCDGEDRYWRQEVTTYMNAHDVSRDQATAAVKQYRNEVEYFCAL